MLLLFAIVICGEIRMKFSFPPSAFNFFPSTQLQVMVPYNYTDYINDLTSLVHKGVINISRIDDAVKRILRVKFTMGLFENPLADLSFAEQLGKKVGKLVVQCFLKLHGDLSKKKLHCDIKEQFLYS